MWLITVEAIEGKPRIILIVKEYLLFARLGGPYDILITRSRVKLKILGVFLRKT